MRFASLSFLVYTLSLVAVTSGQNALVSDVGNIFNSGSVSAMPTETTSTESSTDSDTSTSDTPTATPTDSTTTSSDEESSATPTPTSSDSTTTSTSSSDATTTTDSSDSSSTGTTTSSRSSSHPTTITTIQTISGTPVPTTMTSAASDSASTSPSLSTSNEDSSDSGLSSQNKKVIIGVVVGVGGALILGVLGIVIWRIRSKKGGRNDPDEAADLMSGTAVGTGNGEKAPSPGAASGNTPFRSTLDQYHNPGNVNAASNF